MSLQGTLDAFSLPEVLRLLVAGRTGTLRLAGDLGSGCLWLDNGRIVRAEAERADPGVTMAEVLFELLRLEGGSFAFHEDDGAGASGVLPAGEQVPVEVDTVLSRAEELLAEWREVESVVPTATTPVRLASALPHAHVNVDHRQWHLLVVVASNTTVADVGRSLDLGEVAARRAVKDLVDAGLVAVDAPPETINRPAPISAAAGAPVPVPVATSPRRPWREYLTDETLVSAATRVDLGAASHRPSAVHSPTSPAGSTPAWAGDDILDEAFAEWVPGPSPEAHPVERSLVDLDVAHEADEARGILDKLLASLRS